VNEINRAILLTTAVALPYTALAQLTDYSLPNSRRPVIARTWCMLPSRT
jgi:hypothetical protein